MVKRSVSKAWSPVLTMTFAVAAVFAPRFFMPTENRASIAGRWQARASSPPAISSVLGVGTEMPLHLGSAGTLFLAVDEFARQELLTGASEEGLPAALLEKIRTQGGASSF